MFLDELKSRKGRTSFAFFFLQVTVGQHLTAKAAKVAPFRKNRYPGRLDGVEAAAVYHFLVVKIFLFTV